MADKIKKALAGLSAKEKATVSTILQKLIANELRGLDIKQLKGHSQIYRVRKGNIRIICSVTNNDVRVLTIARRNEKTYKNL